MLRKFLILHSKSRHMFTLENDQLRITVSPRGAELQEICHKANGLQYLWGGDPAFWGKKSPVLFPIVGTLKKNTFYFEGQPFELGRHGFARDMDFVADGQGPHDLVLLLKDNQATQAHYPFRFEFRVIYQLSSNALSVTYQVLNRTKGDIYFSVGGHPAFRVPLVHGTTYSDYYLRFEQDEALLRWPISGEGLIETRPVELGQEGGRLGLTHALFARDALVFKSLRSRVVSLVSDKTTHGLDFHFGAFPYLGIWAAKGADFVCIEPWCGIADSVEADQQLVHKEGMIRLGESALFDRTWKTVFY